MRSLLKIIIGAFFVFTIACSEYALGEIIGTPLEDRIVNSDLIIIAQVTNVEAGRHFYVVTPSPGGSFGTWNWMLSEIHFANEQVMAYLNYLQKQASEMRDKTNGYMTFAMDREIDRHLQRHVATCLVQEELKSILPTSTVSFVFFIPSVGIHSTCSFWNFEKGKRYILFLKKVEDTYELITPYQGAMEIEPKYIDKLDFKDGKSVTTWIEHDDFIKKVRGIVKKTGNITKPSSVPR